MSDNELAEAPPLSIVPTSTDSDSSSGVGTSVRPDLKPMVPTPEQPAEKKDNVIQMDSIPHLEKALRKNKPNIEVDQERLIRAVDSVNDSLAHLGFDEVNESKDIDEQLKALDPKLYFARAYGRYTASAIAMFRNLHPEGTAADQLTFFDVVMIKLMKRGIKYGDVPNLMKDLGIDAEEAFKIARKKYEKLGGLPEDLDTSKIEERGTLKEQGEDSRTFEEETGRSFKGVLSQLRDEISELWEELEEMPSSEIKKTVMQRNWQAARGVLQRLSKAQIERAEKTDPLFGVGGEIADVWIAGLSIADRFGSDSQAMVIREVGKLLAEERKGVSTTEWRQGSIEEDIEVEEIQNNVSQAEAFGQGSDQAEVIDIKPIQIKGEDVSLRN